MTTPALTVLNVVRARVAKAIADVTASLDCAERAARAICPVRGMADEWHELALVAARLRRVLDRLKTVAAAIESGALIPEIDRGAVRMEWDGEYLEALGATADSIRGRTR